MTCRFHICTQYKNKGIRLPRRQTEHSAGYDIRSAETIKVPSIFTKIHKVEQIKRLAANPAGTMRNNIKHYAMEHHISNYDKAVKAVMNKTMAPTMVHTGVKAEFPDNWVLMLFDRSSNPVKRGLELANGTGVIDPDYYDSGNNEGELLVPFNNTHATDYVIHKGDRIVQGVFLKFGTTDDDVPLDHKRKGGFGSTQK